MLDVGTARRQVLEHNFTCTHEVVSVIDAFDRILAEDVFARRSNPIHDISMMDGYAVSSVTTQGETFHVVGEAPAGAPWPHELENGQAIRIYTGGRIPQGASKVIMQENVERVQPTEKGGYFIRLKHPPSDNNFIRAKGSDFSKETCLLKKGHKLTARDIGLLSAAGIVWVTVTRKISVAILATGDEICMPGMAKSHGSTYNSGAFMIHALCKTVGATPHLLPIAPDNKQALAQAVKQALNSDIIVSLGGVSVGDYDLLLTSLKEEDFELSFHKIAMKPGKPLLYGRLKHTLLFGLPGNPVAAYICSLIFLLPAIQKANGVPVNLQLPLETATLTHPVEKNGARLDFMRASAKRQKNGTLVAHAFRQQDSAQLYNLSQANALIVRQPFEEKSEEGAPCQVLLLS